MTENETTPVEVTENAENTPKKRKRGKGGNRLIGVPRGPSQKDWLRVINSTGNGQKNLTIKLIVNRGNGFCELVTNAPKMEGSPEMEGERTQVFRITEYEVIDDPSRDPFAKAKVETAPTTPAEPAPAQ